MSQMQPQIFQLANLTGQDIEAIMNGLNELPAKQSRIVMNKVEGQIIQQVQAQQAAQVSLAKTADAKAKTEEVDAPAEN